MKTLLLITFATLLNAQGLDAKSLDSIYLEAGLFVGLFASMYTVSFFVSRRNANKYEKDNPLEIRREKILKCQEHEKAMDIRLEELSKLYIDKVLSEREFKVLRNNLDYIVI